MINLRKIGDILDEDLQYFYENKIKFAILILVVVFFWVFITFTSSYFSEKGKILSSKEKKGNIEISQIIFNQYGDEFIFEFLVKNPLVGEVLIKKIEIDLSKSFMAGISSACCGSNDIDAISAYTIEFDDSFLRLEQDNNIFVNGKIYFAYVRDYRTRFNESLHISFESPFVIKGNSYTPFRIIIPNETRVENIFYRGNKLSDSKSKDVREIYNNEENLTNIKIVNNFIKLENMGGVFIKLHVDNMDYKIVEGGKMLSEDCGGIKCSEWDYTSYE